MQIRKAERRKAKLRLGLVGPSGSGKTRSSLEIAFGLGGKVGLIDTEHGSGDLYANLGDYDIIQLGPPYLVSKYLQAIKAFEGAGYDVIIIDSLSHAWAGEGGLLDKQGKIADSGSGNSYTAWRKVTPEHNALVETILQSPAHVIATMRAKQDYVQEKDEKSGKTVVRKIGLAPVQRDGMEYEMTVVMDIDAHHVANASKDRTGLLDGRFFTPTQAIGKELLDWLESGFDPLPLPEIVADAPKPTLADRSRSLEATMRKVTTAADLTKTWNLASRLCAELDTADPDRLAELQALHDDLADKLAGPPRRDTFGLSGDDIPAFN